jgi:hypothetical protein
MDTEAKAIRMGGLKVHSRTLSHMRRIHFQYVSKTSNLTTIFPKKL